MSQNTIPFKYEESKRDRGITSLGGLPLYLVLGYAAGLYESVRKHIQIRGDSQGWIDSQVIMSLILLNLAGGDCVEDLNILEGDEGFCRVLRRIELHDLGRKERREMSVGGERRSAVLSPHLRQHFVIWKYFMMRRKRRSASLAKPLFLHLINI